MTAPDGAATLQIVAALGLLLLLAGPVGLHLARVFSGQRTASGAICGPLERVLYRIAGVDPTAEMTWRGYAGALLLFNLLGLLLVYALLRCQLLLPGNPQALPAVPADLAFNTAVSFASNTNWQAYSGETTVSYLVQMAALGVQNFLSAATGIAVMVALARGLLRERSATLGNFWVDLVRATVRVLLPLSVLLALLLVSQGVVQTLGPSREVLLRGPVADAAGTLVTTQTLALGPAASQVAIKQLGTNGGGFYNVNSAHPFENPTPLSNLLEWLAILLIPAASCIAFGRLVKDSAHGRALLCTMLLLFVPLLLLCTAAESRAPPALAQAGVDVAGHGPAVTGRVADAAPAGTDGRLAAGAGTGAGEAPGGNMEGKELRFGIADSALWAAATTAASNGSVNAMHDSFTPLGGFATLLLMQFGEVVFGGVGSGLYGMVLFALVAVFITGLMVGRTPEYLGKKLEAFEMKMASLGILLPCMTVLFGTAVAVHGEAGRAGVFNPGAHGFSEILYAFTSAGNNNGSAFAGLSANSFFYNVALGLAMLVGRYWVIVPVLAIAGSLAAKGRVPAGAGTLSTHGALFVALLAVIVIVVGALTFFPALALGPVVEHMRMLGSAGS